MKVLVLGLFSIFCVSFDASVFTRITILGVPPDLTLCFTVAFAMFNGNLTGAAFGLFSGIIVDITTGTLFGFYALPYMIVGYIAGYAYERKLYAKKYMPMVIAAAGSMIKLLIEMVIAAFMAGGLNVVYGGLRFGVLRALLSAVLVLPAFFISKRLSNVYFMKRKWQYTRE